MILSTAILVILLGSFLNGKNRGLISILLSTITYFAAWLIAKLGAATVGAALAGIFSSSSTSSTTTTTAGLVAASGSQYLYNGIAFALIFGVVSFCGRFLMRNLRFIRKVPVVGGLNSLAGGGLNLLIGYLVIFLILFCLQFVPWSWWQNQLTTSGLAQLIIEKTPGLAAKALTWIE